MKILLIGGTGIISFDISKRILEQGKDELVLLNRGTKNSNLPKGVRIITGDIHDEDSIKNLISNETFDVVANFIAFKKEDIERDFRLFHGRTKQYIFISSASVYQKPQVSVPITESTPLINPYWKYSQDKIECEETLLKFVRSHGFPGTIIRPSHTYNDYKLPLPIAGWSTIKRMLEGKPIMIHGDGTSLWTLTHSRDFAKGFLGIAGNVHTIGDCINITSDEMLSWNQIYKICADTLNVEFDAVHVSTDFLAATSPKDISGQMYGDMINNVIFDNAKLKRLVPGFAADIAFSEGIKKTIHNFMTMPEMQNEFPWFDEWCDAVITVQKEAVHRVKEMLK